MNKIRKGDQVIVLTGRDKGRRGTVLTRVDDEPIELEAQINLRPRSPLIMTVQKR